MEKIRRAFENAGIPVSTEQAAQFYRYYELLDEKNRVMNLTAITEYKDVVLKHFVDSAMLLRFVSCKTGADMPDSENTSGRVVFPEKFSVIDVGTGAGFPGLPLKIVCPEIKLFLLDALQKRIGFLQEVSDEIGLQDVEFRHDRAEDAARAEGGKYRDAFDLAVSRAVADLSVLTEYCLPFVKTGGYFAAYKSGHISEELNKAENAIRTLGGEPAKVERFMLPGTEEERSIVFIRKIQPGPEKYPRKAGKPVKNPL